MAENEDFAKFVTLSLGRHLKGDWGDVDAEDKLSNDEAVKAGDRILSAYNDDRFPKNGIATIWIITECRQVGNHRTLPGRVLIIRRCSYEILPNVR